MNTTVDTMGIAQSAAKAFCNYPLDLEYRLPCAVASEVGANAPMLHEYLHGKNREHLASPKACRKFARQVRWPVATPLQHYALAD